ncbi:PREDICTED: probable disease resistance protein At1g61190 [Camelina sativa]|uniref:Probable disease resistance protein At1g61190 n=1 Tax=Camelina sativa TaxID=90675 RepID=A0ABM0SYR9_CAMSA|nr:PREDICTED: probable disease resistance protein At1g61190 [Camelina sativa]
MGNIVSCQCSGDAVLDRIIRYLCDKGYIRTLKENLRALEREMEDLRAIKDEVQNKVAREEARHQQRLEVVQVWLTRVDSIDIQFKDVLSTKLVQLQKLCFCGFCSKNVCSSYNYGKSVFLLLEEVKKLRLEGNFEVVSEPTPRAVVEEMPTQRTFGHEEMLQKAWNRLMEDGVGIMGLHGMGGVGKTTLFKKIHNKFAEIAGTYDVVIWIVVSQGATISKLQEDIAQKLDLCDEMWKNKKKSDKAAAIYTDLKKKRFVLMLDDIWEKVDLEAIGVPFPTEENKCKVAFTTRSLKVCGQMKDHKPMQVNCLGPEDAWELFKYNVGDDTLRRDPVIVELARRVAEKCRGLPLALCVIGETMASKTTVQEWEHAIDVLTRSAAEFDDMENKILPVLKFSYDSLVDENIKSCFLYCALFPEDFRIDKEKLIEYWICEGFIGEDQVIKSAMNKGYVILGTLIRANLLTEISSRRVVMHDVVREMALWIASDYGEHKENFVVRAGVGLHEVPQVKDWGAVRRMSLMKNDIREITCSSKCSQLTTLFLQQNRFLKNLSGEFIQSMQNLVVLDLSCNRRFSELPEQISELASLRYLNLSQTKMEQLPVGLHELSSLRILKLRHSYVHGDASLIKELQLLQDLQVLTITISTEMGLEQILDDQRLANCITDLMIKNFQQKPFNISILVSMNNLCSLWVKRCHVSEIDTYLKCKEISKKDSSNLHSPSNLCFTNLSSVNIIYCHSIKDLTWLLFAPNLVSLLVKNSDKVEEIINKEIATNLTGIITTPFQKLECLDLHHLPKLKSIYWSPLPFPFLKHVTAYNCPKLRKLPLNATSVPRLEGLTIEMRPREHGNDLEWEDENTKDRFLPSLDRRLNF